MRRIQKIMIAIVLLSFGFLVKAQELNAKITINSDKVQGSSKQIFTTLENALMEFVNNKKWTSATFSVNERIDCSMNIIVNERTDDSFKAEIQVQARRPVYNSSYSTTLLNFRDRQFDFDYVEFQPLEYSENTLESNLTATIVFYIYIILGLDFDSFSPMGGTSFFQQAMQIVNLAQSQPSWNGWKPFDSSRNRHALVTALTENVAEGFRNMWYTYYRKGLDEMAANADRGRTTIISDLLALKELKSARPTSVLLSLFSDAKLDEVVAIYSEATNQEKQEGYKFLSDIYPTESTRLEPLKK
ncbi:MAG: DUF4835 family protein [Massilibacteroides sp.]|nr:DUF4835 family protein [Massilibacteroides sp.]MDD3062535.1 DUF4835 family protein [Massilibacteroides sp.]MDD4659373.1 DUF4835 family protein [Massilibacteroides sp.]